MKKLVAKKAIQYGGCMYEPGAALPAHDQTMVKAWLGAGTAKWQETAPTTPDTTVGGLENEGWKVINALLDMGITLTDDNGAFVGFDALADSIRAVFSTQVSVTGNLDAKQLDKLTRDELDRMAADMGLDTSDCKNKGDVVAVITAAPVQALANKTTGGAQ